LRGTPSAKASRLPEQAIRRNLSEQNSQGFGFNRWKPVVMVSAYRFDAEQSERVEDWAGGL